MLTYNRIATRSKGTYTLRTSRHLKLAEAPLTAEVLGKEGCRSQAVGGEARHLKRVLESCGINSYLFVISQHQNIFIMHVLLTLTAYFFCPHPQWQIYAQFRGHWTHTAVRSLG